ncbi:hypothetical protein LVD15_25920 [Fulvivirga maritima]|uniref:hypothetical protein n=1 Tax=Fulvivirga maritima TaxID=2904247 RepID=UPI001F3D6EA0|nr:hypothetical protein [Fulvivirga maritima]UII26691.1 hypothetical protein LVD15_25920 [Fulvivirga maritima]
MKNHIYNFLKVTSLSCFVLAAACTPEDEDLSLGQPEEASFTVSEVAGEPNFFILENTTPNAFMTYWDMGRGFEKGEPQDTVFFPDQGEYEVRLRAVSPGGIDESETQMITVATSDPAAGNLIQGADMDSFEYWTKFYISANHDVDINLEDGHMVASGNNDGHVGIYQPINVEADKVYNLSVYLSGNGATDVWLEVYMGDTEPEEGVEYSEGGNLMGLNTWVGCGNSAFSGNLAVIGCTGSLVEENGEIEFETGGTKYLVIRTGGVNLGDGGIVIDRVEFRGTR